MSKMTVFNVTCKHKFTSKSTVNMEVCCMKACIKICMKVYTEVLKTTTLTLKVVLMFT